MGKNETRPYLTMVITISTNWIKDLILDNIIKLFKETMGENLHHLELSNAFLDITPKTSHKRKINKLSIIKSNTFCFKGYHKQSER